VAETAPRAFRAVPGAFGRAVWALRSALLAALAVFAVAAVARRGDPSQLLVIDAGVFPLVYLLGGVLCWWPRARGRAELLAWRALGAAMVLNAAGNLYYSIHLAHLAEPPYPSLADFFFIAWYPLIYLTVMVLLKARVGRFHPSMWLDGLVAGLGAAALLAAAVGQGVLAVSGASQAEIIVNLAYPVGDLLLLLVLVGGVAALGGRLGRALWLVTAGLFATGVADVLYLAQDARGTYVEGGATDLTWLVGIAVMALAAGLTRRTTVAPHRRDRTNRDVRCRIMAMPMGFAVTSLGLLGLAQTTTLAPLAGWFAVACIAVAMARAALTFREVRDLAGVHVQARTDDLTGLPNRRALYEQIETLLGATTAGNPLSLLLLDLDRFKEVNDSLGHAAGDDLLVQVGQRFQAILGPTDVLARLGGDEFAVLLPDTDPVRAVRVAHQIIAALTAPFLVETIQLHVDVSIGAASAPVPAATRSELLRCADVAMYDAKAAGSGVAAYTRTGHEDTLDRLRTLEELRAALDPANRGEGGRLVIHLQPQLSLRPHGHGQPERPVVTGMEALVRWDHPTRGLLPPDQFLALADTAGLMGPLSSVVLDQALSACREWWAEGLHLPVSVNLCAANVHDTSLPAKIEGALDRHRLPARALVVELTEDAIMTDPARARTVLAGVRDLGVAVSIDDYGTGYSSLAYLRNLAVDELKLDRVFVADLLTDPASTAIVRHTVDLAHALGLRLVAEGIEDPVTAAMLAGFGCDIGQGFHYAHPMPPDVALEWLRSPDAHTAKPHALPSVR
jgi:diguanylate cyclase